MIFLDSVYSGQGEPEMNWEFYSVISNLGWLCALAASLMLPYAAWRTLLTARDRQLEASFS